MQYFVLSSPLLVAFKVYNFSVKLCIMFLNKITKLFHYEQDVKIELAGTEIVTFFAQDCLELLSCAPVNECTLNNAATAWSCIGGRLAVSDESRWITMFRIRPNVTHDFSF